ncbi:hypothetical protein ACJQWK_01346 [Exserohilum turcicum]
MAQLFVCLAVHPSGTIMDAHEHHWLLLKLNNVLEDVFFVLEWRLRVLAKDVVSDERGLRPGTFDALLARARGGCASQSRIKRGGSVPAPTTTQVRSISVRFRNPMSKADSSIVALDGHIRVHWVALAAMAENPGRSKELVATI